MEYNKGDNIKVQISNITDIGAFVKLEGRASGMIHYSEVPCKFGQVSDFLKIGQEIEVIVLGPGKPDKYGNPRYNLSKKKVDEQAGYEKIVQAKEEGCYRYRQSRRRRKVNSRNLENIYSNQQMSASIHETANFA